MGPDLDAGAQARWAAPFLPAGLLALLAGAMWWLKMAVMAADSGSDQGLDVVATYFVGLLALVARGHGGLGVGSPRGPLGRVAAALAGAVGAYLVHQAMDVVGDLLVPGSGWFQEESSIWLTAFLALVAGLVLLAAGRPSRS